MSITGSRKELQPFIDDALTAFNTEGMNAFIKVLHDSILKKKVRFPVLEYAAGELCNAIPGHNHIPMADKVAALAETGGYVIAGMVLQYKLQEQYDLAIDKAIEYIICGNEWYVCDIIGERVMGYALLTKPARTLRVLKKLAKHEDKWIVRSVGVAVHYAVKKGLDKEYVQEAFVLLLSLSNTTDFHTKKGIGWAAKTVAKFHPGIIATHKEYIDSSKNVKQWFKTKIKIGLGRTDKYAHRYRS